MASYTRTEVINKMRQTGVVPLFYHHDYEVAKAVLTACYNGGSRVFEFTNRGDFAHEVFGRLSRYVVDELPGMALGAGSITDVGTTSIFLQLGANFIITPVFREDVAKTCNRRKILWSPGCGSLGEIAAAEELGCEIVKLFPGGNYGPEFVKAIKGPHPWTSIMPTGGVEPNEQSLQLWFRAGVDCVGLGSKLISSDILEHSNYSLLENRVRDAISIVGKIRDQ